MQADKFKRITEELLSKADVEINGNRPGDIHVYHEDFYQRLLTEGSLGLGESYMDKWWDCEKLDEFFCRVLSKGLDKKIKKNWRMILEILLARIFNQQSKRKAFHIAKRHYDLDNDLFRNMLDKYMVYSCAYWEKAETLDGAQEHKLDLICRKLGLQPGMKILDMGCGWGGFAKYAAERYKVKVTGITVSNEQVELGRIRCEGLPVEIRLQDYRDLNQEFDRIVSVGMFEHVGHKNFRTYMKTVHRCLKEDGLFLLQTIGQNSSANRGDPWIDKYIFPGGMLPSIKQIASSIESLFIMEDWHSFGTHYDKTLLSWFENFHKNWDKLQSKYDERFYRMWKFYLLVCAGSFRARMNQLWQMVLSKKGVVGGYRAIR